MIPDQQPSSFLEQSAKELGAVIALVLLAPVFLDLRWISKDTVLAAGSLLCVSRASAERQQASCRDLGRRHIGATWTRL